jgi:hypothetical protein
MIVSAYIVQNKCVMQLRWLINSFLLNLKAENPDETHIIYCICICVDQWTIYDRGQKQWVLQPIFTQMLQPMTKTRLTTQYYPCIKCYIFHNTAKKNPNECKKDPNVKWTLLFGQHIYRQWG